MNKENCLYTHIVIIFTLLAMPESEQISWLVDVNMIMAAMWVLSIMFPGYENES